MEGLLSGKPDGLGTETRDRCVSDDLLDAEHDSTYPSFTLLDEYRSSESPC